MSSFSIQDDNSSDHLTIRFSESKTIFGSCNGYVEAEVEIKAGNFGGGYKTEFTDGDLPALQSRLREIYTDLSGSLSFATLEGQLEFKITGDGRGHFETECEAQESWNGSRLIFTLSFDQTHIPRMIRELEGLLSGHYK